MIWFGMFSFPWDVLILSGKRKHCANGQFQRLYVIGVKEWVRFCVCVYVKECFLLLLFCRIIIYLSATHRDIGCQTHRFFISLIPHIVTNINHGSCLIWSKRIMKTWYIWGVKIAALSYGTSSFFPWTYEASRWWSLHLQRM